MKKRFILTVTAVITAAALFAACTDEKPDQADSSASFQESSVETTSEEEEALDLAPEPEETEETVIGESYESEVPSNDESGDYEDDALPAPGDTYNGHTVDHTEDQPNCDDGSHGTIWIFYTDSDDIDYIEY